jgi:tetratricopeptide (TPR) repeat protein
MLLGDIYHVREDLFQAEAYFRAALEIYREMEAANPRTKQASIATTLRHLGDVYCERKAYQESLAAYQESLALFRALTITNQYYRQEVVCVLLALAVYYQRGVPDKSTSVQYAREVIAYRHSAGHNPSVRGDIERAKRIILQWKESL